MCLTVYSDTDWPFWSLLPSAYVRLPKFRAVTLRLRVCDLPVLTLGTRSYWLHNGAAGQTELLAV